MSRGVVVPTGEDRVRLYAVGPAATEPSVVPGSSPNGLYYGGLAVVLAFGVCLRLVLPGGVNFPLGDGGMFYQMVRDLLAHHLVPPYHTAYNHLGIPFAYPFFGFYVIALLHLGTGLNVLTLMQWVPPIVCCLSLGAFALLARALLSSQLAQVGAVAAFALLPDSFGQEIKGGGITRAWGELFCLLALVALVHLLRRGERKYLITAAVFTGLTILSHLEWVWFLGFSALVLWACLARTRRAFLNLVVVGIAGTLLAFPWWGIVLPRFGLGAILATFVGSAQGLPLSTVFAGLLTFDFAGENWLPLFTPLALLGVVVCWQRRDWLLPVWLAAVWLLNWRGTAGHSVIPVALLAGVGIAVVWDRVLGGRGLTVKRWGVVVLILVMMRTLFASWIYTTTLPPALTTNERAAMQWAATHTAPSARFVVVSGADWALDDNAEWFPALTGRASVSTVQGTEWLSGVFARRLARNIRLQKCADSSAACLEHWLRATGNRVDYVYVVSRPVDGLSKVSCCAALRLSLLADPHFRLVYRAGETAIFRQIPTTTIRA